MRIADPDMKNREDPDLTYTAVKDFKALLTICIQMFHKSSFPFTKEIKLVKYIYSDPDLVKKVPREKYREQESQNTLF